MLDLTGQRFGRLVVLSMAEPYVSPSGNKSARCLCKCDCGNIKTVHVSALKGGRTKSCGCYNADAVHERCFMDLTGQTFGYLTVLYRSEDKVLSGKRRVTWHCRCTCGNEKDIFAIDLRTGKCISCGCKQHSYAGSNFIDLTGQKFGKLTVIKRVEDHQKPSGNSLVQWLCKCECGSEKVVSAESLRSGHTQSCGCVLSYAEETIARLLTKCGIPYYREYSFPDCVSALGNPLYFDFAIRDKDDNVIGLIEYQGEQHYLSDAEIGMFGKIQRDETDIIKKEYCKQHDIKLFEIRFDENINNSLIRIIKALQDNTVPSAENSAKV